MQRVIAYVDGFNLYYGMKEKNWRRYYWLNVRQLVQNLLKPDQSLVAVKYFTSRVSSTRQDPNKSVRQNEYLEALQTIPDFHIYYGHYLRTQVECLRCRAVWTSHDEKMTDVNIAVELMVDSFQNTLDTALVISGDSDLTGPIEAIHRLFANMRVVVGFPPARESERLKEVADSWFIVGRKKLADSQFPDEVVKPDGHLLHRPDGWGVR